MFEASYTTTALKRRKKLDAKLRARITAGIEDIAADPFGNHPNAKKLQVGPAYRLRLGDWRVLYELDKEAKVLLVIDIRHRNEGY